MHSKKIIFLDIDGTIYAKPGVIPDSAKQAIREAKECGHKVYLSTGRNKTEVEADIWELGMDGMVGSAGAYVEHQGNLIFNEHLPKSLLAEVYQFFIDNQIVYTVETNDRLYGTKENLGKQLEVFEAIFSGLEGEEKSLELFNSITEIADDMFEVPGVNKILFYDSPVSIKQINEKFGDRFMIVPSTIGRTKGESAEMYSLEISKATGMEKLITYLGVAREDTVAFGDGGNDFEMLDYAGIGVAMGNGIEELKKNADLVTDEAIKDGLYKGFKMCGLI